jgi:hypothetical protein
VSGTETRSLFNPLDPGQQIDKMLFQNRNFGGDESRCTREID